MRAWTSTAINHRRASTEEGHSDHQDEGFSDEGKGPRHETDPNYDENECFDCGGVSQPQRLRLDLSSAVGLAIVDNFQTKTRKRGVLLSRANSLSTGKASVDAAQLEARLANFSSTLGYSRLFQSGPLNPEYALS